MNEKLDILRDDVESKMEELKDLLSEMAGNVAENIKEIQKTNKITDQKNVIETKGRHENEILMRSKLFLLTFD